MNNDIEPRLHERREIKSRKSSFANDDRMNEFDGDVLGIGRVRAASKGQETSATQKTLRHLAAGYRERSSLLGEKTFKQIVAQQQMFFDLGRESTRCLHKKS